MRGWFGIRVNCGHKPKLPMSEKAYLYGRRISFSTQLKIHTFLAAIGRTISGQAWELSKTGDRRGGQTELRQEQVVENQCFSVYELPCDHFLHVSRTYPEAARHAGEGPSGSHRCRPGRADAATAGRGVAEGPGIETHAQATRAEHGKVGTIYSIQQPATRSQIDVGRRL